ncbi:MAG: putative transposase [Dermatophilaceae bacterium]
MPTPQDLHRSEVDGQVLITVGATVLFSYATDDAGLRNLAAVTLPEMGFTGRRVGQVLGITEEYVSMLRARARSEGSAALTRPRGRPSALGAGDLRRARSWRAGGLPDTAIGRRLGVHATTVARALVGIERPDLGSTGVKQDTLPVPAAVEPTAVPPTVVDPENAEAVTADLPLVAVDPDHVEVITPDPEPAGSARVGTGTYRSRYAGAMLLFGYLDRVGAKTIFGTLTGGPARRYGDLAVLTTATLGFALGTGTVEGTKHLRRAEAGAAVGLATIPELATLRARLSALADGSDPLRLQRAFAAGMLSADPAPEAVYFVDDHFVAYAGARPVAKGWNTKRRHAQPGRDDTLLVDARGRAVVFGSGEPTGLSSTLPGVLTQLRQVIGPKAPVLLGFDRGGAYPVTFTACRDAGADWVTYRRAPLVAVTATPKQSCTVRDGKRISVLLADEIVQLKGYGPARQLTLFEAGAPVLQVLTSEATATGADLLCWLRARWRIENMFKYAAEHNGIDALACYGMDFGPDTHKVTNPARTAARKTVRTAEAELATAERALPQLLAGTKTPAQKNAAMAGIHQRIEEATAGVETAKAALRPIPAKIAANDLDPDAQRARPHLARRGLQMVLRLLAFNAEAWLAERFNAYLTDPDEYRAITRNLLHLGGQVEYTTKQITITLDRPDSPRVARALQLLTDELNTTPACLPGDRRPLTYQITGAEVSTVTSPLLKEI